MFSLFKKACLLYKTSKNVFSPIQVCLVRIFPCSSVSPIKRMFFQRSWKELTTLRQNQTFLMITKCNTGLLASSFVEKLRFHCCSLFPIEKFPSLLLSRNAIMLQHLYYPISALLSVKWSLTRG